MRCIFQAAVATTAKCEKVGVFSTGEGQIPGGGKQERLEVDVSDRVAAAVELFDIDEINAQTLENGIGGGFILLQTH